MKIRVLKLILPFVIVLTLLSSWGCAPGESDTLSNSKLLLLSITGKDIDGKAGSPEIFIDVLTAGSIINDNAVARLEAVLINPEEIVGTYYQAIDIDQVDVEYSRLDGKNEEGVDVPYAFSQYLAYSLEIGSIVELPFIIVRNVAKMEAPLVHLQEVGQEKVLQLTAKITIHSKDKAGNRLTPVVGVVTLWCGNYGE